MPENPKNSTDFLLNGNIPKVTEPTSNATDFLLDTLRPQNKQEFNKILDDQEIKLESDSRYTLDPNKYETKFQSDFKDKVNSFWQGIDETQKSANDYHITKAQLKIATNNKLLKQLDPKDPQALELLRDNENQFKEIESSTEDKVANQKEIDDEYVSKKYKLNEALVQGQGSEAGFFDKMAYTMPNMIGSSVSLVVPNLIATFGTKAGATLATAALAKAGLKGTKAGIVGTATALAAALGGIAVGRNLETQSEVGGQITSNIDKLTQNYIDNTYYQTGEQLTKDQIPQDVMDDIVIQANQGREDMYWENMALAIPDMGEALLFSPKLNLFGTKAISKAISKVADYNKYTRLGTKAVKFGAVYESEKFEEGSQYAYGKRQEDFALNSGEYENKGFIKNLLTDSGDVLSSMNFSPIGEVRGSGRYADDKQFQTAEESGGMLAAIMGGVSTVASVAKDLNTYRKVNKELQDDGVFNVDATYFKLKDQILQKHFENGTTHHLLEGVKNLIGKKNADGTEILTKEQAREEIDKVQKSFDVYNEVNSQVNEIEKKGAFLMFDSAEQKIAKKAVKDNLFHTSLQLVREQKDLADLTIKRNNVQNIINNPNLKDYNNINDLIEKQKDLIEKLKAFDPITTKESLNIPFRIKANEEKLKQLEEAKKAEETRLTEAKIDFKVEPLTIAEQDLNKQIIAKESLLNEQVNKYKELLNIKDDKSLQSWYAKYTKNQNAIKENVDAAEAKKVHTEKTKLKEKETIVTDFSDFQDDEPTEGTSEENPFSIEELTPVESTQIDSDPNFEQSLEQRRQVKQQELDEVFNNTKNLSEVPVGKTIKYKGKTYILAKHTEENVLQLQETDSNKVIDIPLDEEFGYDAPLYYYGISEVNENPITDLIDISTTGLGTQIITIDGKPYLNMFSNPLNAINYDKNGNIVSVTLNTNDKNKSPRTFKKYAEEVAYAILLETYNKLNNETQQNRAKLTSAITKETSELDNQRKEQNTTSRDNEASTQVEADLKVKEDLAKQEAKEISDYNELIDIALLAKTKEELLSYLTELKSNKYYNNKDANRLNNLYKSLPTTKSNVVEETKIPEVKSTSDKHLMLNTPAEARDNQVLYKDKNGVEHLVGEYRTNEDNQLASFEDVRQALEFLSNSQEPKKHVEFIEHNGFVILQVDGVNISSISKKGGSSEQKLLMSFFYDKNGNVKSLDEINNLYQSGVIELNLVKHLNTLLKDDAKPSLAEAYDMLVSSADTVKLKKGNRETNITTTDNEVEYENELSELQSDIAEGLHIELSINGRVDVIKVKTKTNPNAQQSFDEVIQTITNAQGDTKVIKDAIDKFNKDVFFALEPVKGVVRKFQLNYNKTTNTFYFTLQTKDKNTGIYSAPVQMKNSKGINILNNIHPSQLSAQFVIDQLADSNVNPNVQFTAKNIRYSDFSNEEGETDTNKLEVYVDPNGLFKYGVQFSINDEAQPLVATPIQQVPIQTYATSADLEAEKADIKKDRYYNSQANRMVRVQKESVNTDVTQEEIDEIETIIEKAKELGWDKNRLFRQLTSMGYSYALGVHPEAFKNYLEDRLSNKTNIKVSAEYNFFKQLDAELAALENKTSENTTTTLTPQSFEDLLKQAQDESNKESDSDFVFSTGLEESTGITSEEIEAVRAILPRFISIEDIKTIANNLKVKGIPYGVFKNKIIYLNTAKGKPGTAYHEAFHAVFRTVLTEQQIHNYLSIAVKQMTNKGFNISEEIDKLVERVPAYISKTDQELAELVLEEYLADEFSKVAQNPKEIPGNIFGKLWFKIKQFFKFISGSNELDMLFDNILKGKFVNSQIVANRFADNNDSVFKLLPKKNSSQDNGFFNASESRKIIGYFAIKIHKAKLSGEYKDLTDEELLDKFINERIAELDTKGIAYGQSLFTSNPEYAAELANKISAEKYLYNKDSINNVKIRPYDVLKSAVTDKLAIFKYKTSEEANEDTEGGEEAVHMKDTFGSQDAWLSGGHDALSQTIKKYVTFTTQIEKDEITNEAREVGVDEVALYNGLTSILADTSEDRMIAKLYDAKESNPNIKAFYEQIIKDLGITFDPETRTTSYSTNPEASNITRALLTNFKNSKAEQIDVLVGESWVKDANGNKTKVKANTWVNANKNDAKKISLERWKTKVTFISRQKSIKDFQKNFDKIPGIVNNYVKGNISLDKAVQDIDKTGKKGIKELLDENGIALTSIYIKISLAKHKAILNPDKLSVKDKAFISIYDTVEPIDFSIFGSISGSDKFALSAVIKEDLKTLFDEDKGVVSRLAKLAENNAKFDESIANFSFTNAEGKKVYEIIKPSYVLSRPELYKKDSYWESVEKGEGLTEVEKKNTYFLRDNYLVTKHKDLLKNLKINILSGFRDTTATSGGNTKDGVTFGSFDTRTYLVSAISLYYNKGNKETGKYMFRQNEASSTGYVAELPKIDVSSVAGQEQMTDYFLTQVTKEWNRIKREKKAFDKKPGDLKNYNEKFDEKNLFNPKKTGRAFDFTEFQYLRDTLGKDATESNNLYEALVKSALDTNVKELTPEQISAINKGVRSYLTSSFEEFKKIVDSNQIRLFLSEEMKGGVQSYDTLLWEFYVNDYIMSNSLNELMDGDYALSRKDKTDISKRNKGAMASGPDFGSGVHTSAIIKDIDLFTTIKTVNNKIQRVTPDNVLEGFKNIKTEEIISVLPEGVDEKQWTSVKYTTLKVNDNDVNYEVSSYTSNDAMSYSSQYHMMMGAFRLGRVDGATRKTYKNIIQFTKKDKDGKIIRNVNIGDKAQKALSEALASLNSKKTIVFDGINGQYLKMSELGFIRSSISYVEDKDVDTFVELTDKVFDLMSKDDYESLEYRDTIKKLAKLYKPIPGMEYWHNLANNMDLHGVDHLAVESASKGATRNPQDSQAVDLDLSKSKFNVYNANKRLQVETPTGKKEIVTGSQILTLIASELDDNYEVNGVKLGQLRKDYNNAIAGTRSASFKRAMNVIKKLSDGTIDKTELDEVVKRSLAASGADEQLLEFFDAPMNYNMVQMIVKAEQVILSHFSKGVLNQKVNGDKVSLVTDAGINVVREISTGRVVSHHEVVKDPAKYADTTKYEQSKLRYNVEEGDLKYSECMLSQTILTRHGLKIGDMITPEMTEVLKMLGYRIPTGDKQSAMSLKVVSLLPDYYNGIGLFPSEIVHLSGADFDIDSEFIQMPYFWYKKEDPTVPIKYGSEKTAKDAFEGFKFYNLNYDKDFSRDYKEFLKRDFRYQSLKKAVKQVQADIDQVTGKTKQDLILGKQGLAGQMEIIENSYYAQVSKKYGLPYTEKQFIAFGKKPNAVLSNNALDAMISMLANNSTAKIANNTTSTDVLKNLVPKLKDAGFVKTIKSKISEKNKSASDIVGKYDANSKNSAGKNGIGIAANKIQQFAFLMSKVGDKVVKFNNDAFKFEIAGETGDSYSAFNQEGQRIADNLNILLNVFTDNAKDPIAGELNIQFELLGGFTELIMQGMSFENAVKFINLPIIQEYGKIQKALKSKVKTEIEESFNKNNAQAATIVALENEGEISSEAIKLVNKTASKINPEHKEITLKQIENILLGNEFTKEELGDANLSSAMEIQYQALNQFIKVQEQYNVMATLNTFLKLNQGLDTSFTKLNHTLHKAIDTWKLNSTLNTQDRGLSVGTPHIDIEDILLEDTNTFGNVQRALEVNKEVGQKIFIEQTELFTKEFNKIFDSLKDEFKNVGDNVAKVSREFLGYISIKAYLDKLKSIKNETNKEAIQKRLDSINLGLIFNELNPEGKVNLVSQLELLKTNPKTKDNYIVKYFTIKENIIDTKSFVKESNETISLLIDSVKSLYFDNKIKLNDAGLTPRDFVDNMLSYLMVKDNMQFKNNSVAKYLPVNMFGKYSETLDKLITNLVIKNTKLNFAELGYNFRKMYVTDVNTSYGAMQTIKLDPKDNTPVRLNGENLEFVIDTTTEDGLKESSATLSKIFSKLDVKTKIKTWPAFKFPQFIKVRIGNDQYKVYELDSFTNNAKGFTNKKDNFLNYIDASQGVKHNLENAYAAGEKATYKPLDQIGVKDVSVFFPGTYDKAKVLFDQVKPEEVDIIPSITKLGKFTSIEDMGKPITSIEQSTKVNPYTMTSELANDVSTEVNASEITLPEEKPLKVEEKDVTLDAKKNLLAMVNSQELFIEDKEFTEAQYQKLRDRINAAKTMNELMALEENITKCM